MGRKTQKIPTVREIPPSPESSSDDEDSAVDSSSDDEPSSPPPSQHYIAASKKQSSPTVTKLRSPSPESQSDSDDDDEDDDEETQTPTLQTKPTPKPTPPKRPADSEPSTAVSSDDDDEDDDDEADNKDEDEDDEVEETQTLSPTPQPKTTLLKRPADTELKAAPSEKRHKPSSLPGNSRKLFENKVWSADDEVVILNRILEFKTAKGSFGTVNHSEVLESIRHRLSVPDPKKKQLTNKVRGLRDRYLRFKSGKKSVTGPNDELLLKVGDLVWGADVSKAQLNGNVNGNSMKKDRKSKDKGNGVVGEVKEVVMVEETAKEEQKAESCNGGVEGGEGSDSDGGMELEYLKSTDKLIKALMKKMSEEERKEVNEKLRKADAIFKEAYCMKLEVLLMALKKNAGLA